MILRLFLTLIFLLPAPARAWSEFAHRTTAQIASAHLTPAARSEIRRLIRKAPALDTPGCKLTSLEDASVWPDCVRNIRERFAYTDSWHYQNIDVCQPFDINAACPDGNCVTAQIPRQLAILADRKQPDVARLQALAFVMHFVGDMHQPLHLGDKRDRGGNSVSAAYGLKNTGRINLHRIWDSELAERALTEPPAITPRSPRAGIVTNSSVAEWARESWDISRTIVYPELKNYPDTCPAPSTDRALVDAAYITAATAALRLQVQRAGLRTAALLNRALAR